MAARTLAFHLTDRCQLDCRHCLRDPEKSPRDLTLPLIASVLDQAVRVYRSAHVALTGGEPTLHPAFSEVLDLIADRGLTFHLVTNARRFAHLLALLDERPARRKALTVIDFSLDGADEATHDQIRGQGSFREVMGAASVCAVRSIPFLLQMTVNACNQHQIEAMGLLASQLGAARLSFAMMQATGTTHDQDLFLPPDAWDNVHDRVERLAASLRMPVGMPEGFRKSEPFHVCDPFRSELLHVNLDGALSLCCQHAGVPSDGTRSDVAGDLHQTPLLEAHQRLLGIIHEAQSRRLSAMAAPGWTAWDEYPCTFCLKDFGKPHWSGDGASGPAATRERWTGAWSRETQALRTSPRVSLRVL